MNAQSTIEPEDLIFVGICDLAAQFRGKSVPAADLAARVRSGVGYTPANLCISAFGTIGYMPFGTVGDIVLRPDLSSAVDLRFAGGVREHFVLSDIYTQAGAVWKYCPRDFLRRALDRLEKASGSTVIASFEQEFVHTGVAAEPKRAYALASFREQGAFGATLMGAIRAAGMNPDSFLAEYGERQYEITVAPAVGMRAADEAVLLREIARSVAQKAGHRAIFSPMLEPDGTGNGTHIHLSLRDRAGTPTMNDAHRPYGLSRGGEHFVAGILEHMPALAAITTPSIASYYRLTPNRWAPTWANVALQDRSASLRVCPGTPAKFNLEYRVADATACPYLALGALLHAGIDGIERELALPPVQEKPFSALDDEERIALGMRRLPATLGEALNMLENTPAAEDWFGPEFLKVYLGFKRDEIRLMDGLEPQEICDRYAAVY